MPVLDVRIARIEEAEAIARVHVASWQVAYRGIISNEVLDGLAVEERAEAWRVVFRDHDAPLVALRDGVIIGFVGWGPSRDEDVRELGELYAIYVAPDAWGTGAGAALMVEAMTDLRSRFPGAVLWVLRDNARARTFYEGFRWTADGSEQTFDDHSGVIEVRYRIDF